MSETNWYEKMMAEQAAEKELEEKVEKSEMTEEEALEIRMKATITKFESLLDAFALIPPSCAFDTPRFYPGWVRLLSGSLCALRQGDRRMVRDMFGRIARVICFFC